MKHDTALSQPDFKLIAEALRNDAVELQLCQNLPVVDGGAHLVGMVQTLSTRVDALERKVIVSNKNITARILNGIAGLESAGLMPLYSVLTGELIEGCPSTLADLERVSPEEAARLLGELDESVPGGAEQRSRQLKLAFGVRASAV